jgi:hypothetical protein
VEKQLEKRLETMKKIGWKESFFRNAVTLGRVRLEAPCRLERIENLGWKKGWKKGWKEFCRFLTEKRRRK